MNPVRCFGHYGCVLPPKGTRKKVEIQYPKPGPQKWTPIYDEECGHPQWVPKFLALFCVHFWSSKWVPCFRHGSRPAKSRKAVRGGRARQLQKRALPLARARGARHWLADQRACMLIFWSTCQCQECLATRSGMASKTSRENCRDDAALARSVVVARVLQHAGRTPSPTIHDVLVIMLRPPTS